MSYEVSIREVAARPTAVVRCTTTWPELAAAIQSSSDEVYRFLKTADVTQTGHNIVLYLDQKPTLEVGVEVSGAFEPTATVVPSSLPAGVVATTTHMGPYPGLPAAHAAIRTWCAAQGRRAAGPNWEIYGDWAEDPEALRTDVFHLLE